MTKSVEMMLGVLSRNRHSILTDDSMDKERCSTCNCTCCIISHLIFVFFSSPLVHQYPWVYPPWVLVGVPFGLPTCLSTPVAVGAGKWWVWVWVSTWIPAPAPMPILTFKQASNLTQALSTDLHVLATALVMVSICFLLRFTLTLFIYSNQNPPFLAIFWRFLASPPCCVSFMLCNFWFSSSRSFLDLDYQCFPDHHEPFVSNIFSFLPNNLKGSWWCGDLPSSLMVLQISSAMKAPEWCIQPPLRSHLKTVLSEEVWNTLRLNQWEKSAQFKKDLDATWQKINDVTHSIVAIHSRSVHRVHTELHLGHMQLQNKWSKVNS